MAKRIQGNRFTINWFGDEILKQIRENLEPGLWAGGNLLLDAAKTGAPSRSGNLINSGYVATEKRSNYQKAKRGRAKLDAGPQTAVVAFNAFYANFFEDSGARPHVIRPRRGRVLYMRNIGFRRSALHPGVKAKPFLAPALVRNRERIAEAMVAATARGLK